MSYDSSARTAALFLSIALITTNQLPAMSQDLPPQPPTANGNAPAPDTEAPKATATTDAPEIAPGPLEEQRKKLYATIMTAKSYGFGITAYLNAFNSLEDSVKAGAPEKEIKTRLDSIVANLGEQLKRSQQLKIQKPAPPISESSPPPSSMQIPAGVRSALGGLGGGGNEALIEKVKEKWFGGEIPDSIKKKIPANFDPSMLNSDTAKELMRKYQGQ
jgi:hypothetical protein